VQSDFARFTSNDGCLSSPAKLQDELESRLKIPRTFFDRMFVESNGFAGHSAWPSDNEELESYGSRRQ
jgi:hypothetical protein